MQPEDSFSRPPNGVITDRSILSGREKLHVFPSRGYHTTSPTMSTVGYPSSLYSNSSVNSTSISSHSVSSHRNQWSDSYYDGARGTPAIVPSQYVDHHQSTGTHLFPTSITVNRRGNRPRPTEGIQTIFQTASSCYNALDFNQMISVLSGVKPTLETDPPITVITYHFGLGLGHYKLASYETSLRHFLEAESLAKEEKSNGDICLTSYYIGEVEYTQNKFLSAAGYFEIAIDTYGNKNVGVTFNVGVPSLASLYCKCGTTLRYGSKVMEAVKFYRKGVELARSSGDQEDELSAHTSLGNLYQSLGEYGKAVDEYQETLHIAERLKDYVSLGWAHGNLGNAYLGMMKREKALTHLQKAFDWTIQYEPVPQAIGRAYNNLGTVYQSLNDLDRAKEQYEMALNQAIYGSDFPGQARVYGNLGNLLMLQNKYTDAIIHYTETLSISRDRATQITAYHNRGCARFEKAEEERRSYLEGGMGNNTELLTGRKSHLVYVGAEVKDCEEEHKFLSLPEFLRKSYRESQSDLERVVKHHEQTFQDIKGSPRGLSLSVSLFETNARTFQRLQDCSFFLDQWQQALVYAEQSRSRTLGELLLGKHLSHLECSFRTPLDLPQIISIVRSQPLPVVYITYTGSRLLTWVLTPIKDTPMSVSINLFQAALDPHQFEEKSFDHLVRYLLSDVLIEKQVNMYEKCDYSTPTLLNDLHELIAKPLLRLLKSVLHPDELSNLHDLILITDSHTKLLPLAALQDPSSREFLGDRLRFHLMNSLLTLGILQQLPSVIVNVPTDSADMCIVGNPTIPQFTYQGLRWNLGRLPFAEDEAQRIAHTLQTVPVLGNEALKDIILTKINRAKVVHLATHGSASSGFLVFAGTNPLGLTDETFAKSILLFPEDLESLTIPAALVVLSSCDSGRGTVKVDGIQGIARSFLLAGAQAVLTSLWRVPDESASFFMHFFYRYLVDGLPSFTALQKAGHSIRCYTKYSGYIHWSGYQLQGREVQFTSTCNEESNRVREELGPVNVFPQLNEVLKMKQSLLADSKHTPFQSDREREQRDLLYPHRADIQLLLGSLATRPQEIVSDYIMNMHSYYTGGIYWIPGHSPDLTAASLQHIHELLCCDGDNKSSSHSSLSMFFTSLSGPVLLVLDGFHSLPLSQHALRSLMIRNRTHIILTSHISSLPDKLIEQTHTHLTRGCLVHELKPLQFQPSLQRLIYNVVSQYELTPMNSDQRTFEAIEHFTSGQPDLIDISNSLITHCIENEALGDPSDGLRHFNNKFIEPTKLELEKALARDEAESNEAQQRLAIEAKALSATLGAVVLQKSDPIQFVTDDLQIHNKPAILYTQSLIQFSELSPLEYLLLYCLSLLYCLPIHESVLESLEKTLNSFGEDQGEDDEINTEKPLRNRLMTLKFLVRYPHPVVLAPSSRRKKMNRSNVNRYFSIPPIVCEALQLMMTDQDRVVACSLVYHALNDLSPPETAAIVTELKDISIQDGYSSEVLHCVALRGFLLETVSDKYLLFGRDVMRNVAKTYIMEKLTTRGKDGLAELLPAVEL